MNALAAELAAPTVAAPSRLLPPGGSSLRFGEYGRRYGRLPAVAGHERALVAELEASGLTGRGGAGFPTVKKLRAVRGRGRAVVVANGTEGEPTSRKDAALLSSNPHLVIDGVLLAARLVGAEEAIVVVSRRGPAAAAVRAALDERPDGDRIRLATAPERFVAGEETALVHLLNGGDAKPTLAPPRPFEQGVGGRPTLVQNVETLANLALVCRYGAGWFRTAGTDAEPGTALVSVSGAVARPGVLEASFGTPLGELVDRCGGLVAPAQALLVGGYFGIWMPPRLDALLSDESLAPFGAKLGARALVVLSEHRCGVVETARVARYLARQSAGQCGPCVFGLPAVADCLAAIANGAPESRAAFERLPRLHAQIARRGACAHPDGAVGFVESALAIFRDEVAHHLAGGCTAHDREPVLPTPAPSGEWR